MRNTLLLIPTVLACSIITANAYADADYSASSLGKGGYYAVDLGLSGASADFKNKGVYSKKASKAAPTLGALLGIGETTGNWYTGIEAGLQFSRASMDLTHTSGPSSYKDTIGIKNFFALDVIPGYFISNNFLAYGRIGYSFGRLEFKRSINGAEQFTNGTDLNNIRLGFGAVTPLTKDLSIGADFVHTFAPAYSFTYNNNEEFTIKLSSNDLTLRLQYSMS